MNRYSIVTRNSKSTICVRFLLRISQRCALDMKRLARGRMPRLRKVIIFTDAESGASGSRLLLLLGDIRGKTFVFGDDCGIVRAWDLRNTKSVVQQVCYLPELISISVYV